LRWSHIEMVSHWDGLSLGWYLIEMVSHWDEYVRILHFWL